ncbi:Peroxisomal membrane protein MPV17 [Handroanthus impetiginosus]|uniref:Peroxisomal membrane protein MPV17 n=1 Tax=Handroanthus impetiginosus TaxID=429701 RepID=A0A2G9G3P0_9LAMI|nr:Peroxisomal membrane protein MPV17 [Handroanthus impetiginosus]
MAAANTAAAALTKNGLLKTHHRRHLLHCFWMRICTKHSLPDPPITASKNIGDHLAEQSKWRSIFPSSFFRRTKQFEFSAPSLITSTFSFRKSSSSRKSRFVAWYLGMLQTRPVSTKSITSAFIYTAADLSSQTIMGENSEGYDLVRTLRMAGYGLLIIGPSLHYWFNFVSRVFPKRDIMSTFKKMALGQTVYGPTVTAIFFSVNAALQGENGYEIVARLKRDLIPTLISGVMYWPLCDFITFKFIPLHLQPLVSNSFSYLWTVYLTYMASLEKASAS